MNPSQLNLEETNQAAVRRLYDECLNQGKFEAADQFISPAFTGLGPDGGAGPAGFKAVVTRLRTGFPDIHFTLHDLFAANNRVALRWTWEGTHRGPFMNFPPTEKRVRQEGIVLYRFEGGQVVEARVQFDRLGFLQQLGILPEGIGGPAARPAKP